MKKRIMLVLSCMLLCGAMPAAQAEELPSEVIVAVSPEETSKEIGSVTDGGSTAICVEVGSGTGAEGTDITGDGICVTGEGSVGLAVYDKAQSGAEADVAFGGDILVKASDATGVYADDESRVAIDGSVESSASDDDEPLKNTTCISAQGDASVTVSEDVGVTDIAALQTDSTVVLVKENAGVTIDGGLCAYGTLGNTLAEVRDSGTLTLGGALCMDDFGEGVGVSVSGDGAATLHEISFESVGSTMDFSSAALVVTDNATASAEGDITIEGKNNAVVCASGSASADIAGDISVENTGGAVVYAEGDSRVQITGDITDTSGKETFNFMLMAYDDAEIEMTGDILNTGITSANLWLLDNSRVTINGDVSCTGKNGIGAQAIGNSSLTINGDLAASGWYATALSVCDDATVEILGNASVGGMDSVGITANGSGNVLITGDVSGANCGSLFVIDEDGSVRVCGDISYNSLWNSAICLSGNGSLIVEGDLRISGAFAYAFDAGATEDGATAVIDGTVVLGDMCYLADDVEDAFCTDIYLTGIEFGTDAGVTYDDADTDAVMERVHYIVWADDGICVARTSGDIDYNETLGIASAQCGDTLLVQLERGYCFDGADCAFTDNGDGTYTLTVTREGHLVFRASVIPVSPTTKKTSKASLSRRVLDGRYGAILTDAQGNALGYRVCQRNGILRVASKEDAHAYLNITRALAKDMRTFGAKYAAVTLNGHRVMLSLSEIEEIFASDGDALRILLGVDTDGAGDVLLVTGDKTTDITADADILAEEISAQA